MLNALPTDFGTYTCVVHNAMGYSEAKIELERQGEWVVRLEFE